MLTSALGALSDRLDSKFLTAYWLPAFVAVLGGFGIFTVLAGPEQLDHWINSLDSVEQSIAILFVVLVVSMLAFVLRALTRPIAAIFAGDALPRSVAAWSTRSQRTMKCRAAQVLAGDPNQPASAGSAEQTRQWLNRVYPLDDAEVRPTLFGNVLATAVEYPRLAYMMDGMIWWPRLSPLVPLEFQQMLGGAQAPMMSLLNLSVIFTALALGGAGVFALAGGHWIALIAVLLGGLLLSRLCYRAAVSQAAEVASLLRVGFDLYRHDILRQMDLEVPADLAAERALWRQLTTELLGSREQTSPAPDQLNKGGNDPAKR